MIDIINRALTKLGETPISSTNQRPNGEIFGVIYNDVLDVMLATHDWDFAIKRAILAPDVKKPMFGWSYQYSLPADYISLYAYGTSFKQPNLQRYIGSSDKRFSLEGGKILCNEKEKICIVYVAKVEDISKFTPWFKQAFITKLAAEFAMRVKQDKNLADKFDAEFKDCMREAIMRNEILDDAETIPDSSWVTVREF